MMTETPECKCYRFRLNTDNIRQGFERARGTSSFYATAVVVAVGILAVAPAQAQTIQVLSENWENPADTFAGTYSGNGGTATTSNTAGAGVGGSRAGIFSFTTANYGFAGANLNTINNPNQVTGLGDMLFSFDARIVSPQAPGPVLFYAQSWSGVFGTYTGSDSETFVPSSAFQHYSFLLSGMTPLTGDNSMTTTDQTLQFSWQMTYPDYTTGTNSLILDNITVTAVRSAGTATSPEPSSLCLFGATAMGGIGYASRVRLRRRKS